VFFGQNLQNFTELKTQKFGLIPQVDQARNFLNRERSENSEISLAKYSILLIAYQSIWNEDSNLLLDPSLFSLISLLSRLKKNSDCGFPP